MSSRAPTRPSRGKYLLIFIIIGLLAYTGFMALKLTRQVPMNTPAQNAVPDASRAGDVLQSQDGFLNLPQGAATPTPDVPAPPTDQATSAADAGAQDNADSNSGTDAPASEQPKNVIRMEPAPPTDDTADAPDNNGSSQPPASPDASQGAPVVPVGPNAQPDAAGGAPVVPLNPASAPADSAHKDQLRQFLHDSLQRALHNPQQ